MDNKIDWWRVAGQYYGYPQCCIDAFCSMEQLKDPEQRQFRAGNHTGFVPCPKCAEKVLAGELKLRDLISNRHASKPFGSGDCDKPKVLRGWYNRMLEQLG